MSQACSGEGVSIAKPLKLPIGLEITCKAYLVTGETDVTLTGLTGDLRSETEIKSREPTRQLHSSNQSNKYILTHTY